MTETVIPVENIHAARWRSALSAAVASTPVPSDPKEAEAHQAMVAATIAGVSNYCQALSNGEAVNPHPGGPEGPEQNSDPEIAAYLAQLHHRRVHNKCTVNDPQVESDIALELKRFTFGNPLWQQMSQQYFDNCALYPTHVPQPPLYRAWNDANGGKGDPDFGVIAWRLPANARVAIVGDIGTGTDIAAAALVSALSFKPDAILHVGDVYFSGTGFEFEHRLVNMLKQVMKEAGCEAPFFTVPGNHEYFTGNVPYFQCLDSGVLVQRPDQQQRASYFALMTEDEGWQFLGMDTGYYGHYLAVNDDQQRAALALLHAKDPRVPADLPIQKLPPNTEMVLLRDDEAQWQRGRIERFAGQSILFSHHPLYSTAIPCGVAPAKLANGTPDPSDINRAGVDTAIWRQLGRFFGDKVPAWFWGHEHNLAIYQDNYLPADWPKNSDVEHLFRPLPKGRCIGHSAIPVAVTENPYAQNNPVPLIDGTKLGVTSGWYNHGFEILELAGAGKPLSASYYQIVGADPAPKLIYREDIGGRAAASQGKTP
jgi:predicted phosphodiesterase